MPRRQEMYHLCSNPRRVWDTWACLDIRLPRDIASSTTRSAPELHTVLPQTRYHRCNNPLKETNILKDVFYSLPWDSPSHVSYNCLDLRSLPYSLRRARTTIISKISYMRTTYPFLCFVWYICNDFYLYIYDVEIERWFVLPFFTPSPLLDFELLYRNETPIRHQKK